MSNELTNKRNLANEFLSNVDKIYDSMWGDSSQFDNRLAVSPAIDITESDSSYVVSTELPGVKKDDIDISVKDGVLTINAESKFENQQENERIIRQERHYGKIVRSLRLGKGIQDGNIAAKYNDGILELTIPKAESVKPLKISISD